MTTHSMQPSYHGLSNQEALSRLEKYGANELPSTRARTFLEHLLDVMREPMVFLLLAGGVIYLVLGDRQEALSLIGFLILIVGITLYQERRTEKALDALRDLSSPRATVIRNGVRVVIPGQEIVPGDLLVLSEGNQVAADGQVLASSHLATDESLLTGEAHPANKYVESEGVTLSQGSLLNAAQVFAGSTVVRGEGLAWVTETGLRTKLGQIGKSLQSVSQEKSRLQLETRQLVRILAWLAAALCLLVIVAYALTRHDLLGGFLAGITLAMAILPNELPAVLLIFLATGAWRLSRRRVLTRKVSAVEALGAATVLCVDKTGTLTLNRMTIRAAWVDGKICHLDELEVALLPEDFHEVFEYGILASRPTPFDPMEKAFHFAGAHYLAGTEHLHRDWSLLREYPISDSLLAVSYAWRSNAEGGSIVAAKGAPEAIVDLCHLAEEQAAPIHDAVQKLAEGGYRVLGVAKSYSNSPLPTQQHDLDYTFIGLIGLTDPIRPDVPHSIRECAEAGVRVMMITGDHSTTAQAIARQIGLPHPSEVLTGPQILSLDDEALKAHLKVVNVCARTLPEQKLRIVTMLKELGEVVAMTGDGVNDAPALKAADIGIAMGQRGTDVAREAASLVLLDDDFSSIVAAIRMGRRIFTNLQHALSYLLSVHVPIAALSILPVFFKLPLILLPIHIAVLHLIIEPACTFVFEAEPESESIMKIPPRDPSAPLFSAVSLKNSVTRGVWSAFVILSVYLIALWRGQGEQDARALTFTTLMFANLGLILTNRSKGPSAALNFWSMSRTLRAVILTSIVLLSVVLYVPGIRDLFRFSHLHPVDLLICIVAGLIGMIRFPSKLDPST